MTETGRSICLNCEWFNASECLMHINHAQFIPFLVLCFIRVVSIQSYEASIQPGFLGWDLSGKTLFQSTFYFKVENPPQNTDWKDRCTSEKCFNGGKIWTEYIPHGALLQRWNSQPDWGTISCQVAKPAASSSIFRCLNGLQTLTDHCIYPTNWAWWRQASFQNSQAPPYDELWILN